MSSLAVNEESPKGTSSTSRPSPSSSQPDVTKPQDSEREKKPLTEPSNKEIPKEDILKGSETLGSLSSRSSKDINKLSDSPPTSIVLDDVPHPPPIILPNDDKESKTFTFHHGHDVYKKSLWERFLEKAQEMAPNKLRELMESEKVRILKEMNERGYLTEEEAEYFNKMTRESIEKILNSFKESVLKHLHVSPEDSPAEVKFKIGFAEQLLEWLADLFQWVVRKLKEIFYFTNHKIEWCIEQTKRLFEFIRNSFKF